MEQLREFHGNPFANQGWWQPVTGLRIIVFGNLTFWLVYAIRDWLHHGFFTGLGLDWSRFWAAAHLLAARSPADAYHLSALSAAMQPLAQYSRLGAAGVRLGPVPYPPILLAIFHLFIFAGPPQSFFLWTLANLGLASIVAWQLAHRFRNQSTGWIMAAQLVAYPLLLELFVGQVVVLLVFAFAQAVFSFEQGKELRAGLWIGLLLMKPQYAFILLPVLLFKCRWLAVLGSVVTGFGILISSLLIGGLGAVVSYVRMILTIYPHYSGNVGIDPHGMISWRAVVDTLLPFLNPNMGIAVTLLLSLLSLIALPFIWRGRWNPAGERFAWQLLGTMTITLLAAYHSEPTGAALLLVPGVMIIAQPGTSNLIRQLLIAGLWLMPIVGVISALTIGDLSLVAMVMAALVVAMAVAVIVVEYGRKQSMMGEAEGLGHAVRN